MNTDYPQKYALCITVCNDCSLACNYCAASFLLEDDKKMMAACTSLDMDCVAICQIAVAAMARNSIHTKAICMLCADICKACGVGCERIKLCIVELARVELKNATTWPKWPDY